VFNICCPEEDVIYYDQDGISQYDFLTIYNEGISHLEEQDIEEDSDEDYSEDEDTKEPKVKKLVKLKADLLHKLGSDAELVIG
jgi:peptide chain release factor subunit 3